MIDRNDVVATHFRQSCEVLDRVAADPGLLTSISAIAGAITRAFRDGAKLLIAGNGGSAADAQHIAGELLSRFGFDRAPLPAIALTTDTSVLTAIGNDYGFDRVFERQVRGLGRPGDIFLALSTSGRSPNVLCALRAAREIGMVTIGFTGDSRREMTAYCLERKLPINQCGKLVVARNATELAGLDELLRRAGVNGVKLEVISADDARKIEPRVKTFERALFSPTTSSVDPASVMTSLAAGLTRAGVEVRNGTAYLRRANGSIQTSTGPVSAGYVINAAGLYADRVARDFGFSREYAILPFKGVYLYGDQDAEPLHANVYPVPDLKNPFLGTHFTVTVDRQAMIGPTAMPAFWREQYQGFENFRAGECADVVRREAGLFLRNDFGFRGLALQELRKYSRRHLVALAAELVAGVRPEHYRRWGRPGIRAQLVNTRERKLEMDFRLEGDGRSFHVLNAVSPAFTCAFSFGRYVVDQVEKLGR